MQTAERAESNDLSLLNIRDVCTLLKLSDRGLRNMIESGEFPHPLKIGRSTRWRAATVRRWLEDKEAAAA